MAHLQINGSLYISGPYTQLLPASAACHFALALSAGMSEPPANADKRDWLQALYPWNLTADCQQVQLYAENTAGVVTSIGQATRQMPAGTAPAGFLDELKKATNDKLVNQKLLEALRLDWDGVRPETAAVEAANATTVAAASSMPAAALLHSLASLPPRLAAGLGALLHFKCENAVLAAVRAANVLIVVPDRITDVHAGEPIAYGQPNLPERKGQIFSVKYSGANAPVLSTPGINLVDAMAVDGNYGFDLGSYWLPVQPALGEGLDKIGQTVDEMMYAALAVGAVPAERLAGEAGWLQVHGQAATKDQAERFLSAAAPLAAALDAKFDRLTPKERAEKTGELVARALKRKVSARDGLYQEFGSQIGRQWESVLDTMQQAGEFTTAKLDIAKAVDYVLQLRFPATPLPSRAAKPGEAIEICVGKPESRLLHADDQDAVPLLDQLAGIGLLVRRGGDTQPWRLATAGLPVTGSVGPIFNGAGTGWLAEMQPAPLTAAFVNQLLSTDFTYDGTPMRTAKPLDSVHPERPVNQLTANLDVLIDFSLHSPNGVAATIPGRDACRTPPLRYGDDYAIAAFAIDRTGGMPAALSSTTPWEINFSALDTVTPGVKADIRYLRRVAPGPVRLSYVHPTLVGQQNHWPQTDARVALRVTEYLDAQQRQERALAPGDGISESLPVLVLAGDANINAPGDHVVALVPPTIDEHTLSRWAMPAINDPKKLYKVAQLKGALHAIFSRRRDRLQDPQQQPVYDAPDFPHDPAITAIWVRAKWIDREGVSRGDVSSTPVVLPLQLLDPGGTTRHYQYALPQLRIEPSATPGAQLLRSSDSKSAVLQLPAGSFAIVDVAPLVSDADWTGRFKPKALEELYTDDAPTGFVAFHPQRLCVESAVSTLPDEHAVYAALALEAKGAGVDVRLRGKPKGLAFIDRFVLARQRWIWRNRPLFDPDSGATGDELRRLMASGLPRALLSENPDERDGVSARQFDALAGLDRGLANRPDFGMRFPRDANGAPAADAALLFDTLDGVSSAEYLRYGLQLVSRYQALFRAGDGVLHARRAQEEWRRITVGYRGDIVRIKPPKVLAVIPMTHGFSFGATLPIGAATPVLVLLDDVWFREYGVGERLEVRLALENADIGEAPYEPRPYRTGGLPDHHLPPVVAGGVPYSDAFYYRKIQRNEAQDLAEPILLDVFGPFGYSFDRSGNEALANASAFVVYPPRDVKAHSAMFLRLARMLDAPSGGVRSVLSAPWPVYTLPDADGLARQLSDSGPGLVLARDGSVVEQGVRLNCDPGAASEARENYLYCLLVSEQADDGGRGVVVELPVQVICLSGAAGALKCERVQLAELPGGRPYVARVIELLLNGKHAPQNKLREALKLAEFWRQLLPDERAELLLAVADVPAVVRRVSRSFRIEKDN